MNCLSKNPLLQTLRKIVFPFTNFLLNQKTRMYTDLGSVFSKSNTMQDKTKSLQSLAGLVGEGVAFNTIGLFVTQTLANIARGIRGTDEDEEELDKQLNQRIKGRVGQFYKDIVSPFPIVDPVIMEGTNFMIRSLSDEEDPYQFFVNNPESLTDRLGVLGIPIEKGLQIKEMVMLGTTGKYLDQYGRTRELILSIRMRY